MEARDRGRQHGRRFPVARVAVGAVLAMLAGAGCRSTCETTDRLVPRSWTGNPWGPEANAARRRGAIPTVPNHPEMAAWATWGRRHLRDGDLLFRMGDARAAFGLLPFSRLSAAISASRFSHSGIVAFEGGEPVVYDTSLGGPQRQPFAIWLLDARGAFAVKRPRAPYRHHAPRAAAFCRDVYRAQVPFDPDLKLGDDRFYCVELTQRAYASSGLDLARPVRLDRLPRFAEFPKTTRLMQLFSKMVPDQEVYVIGNETLGLWSSPALETVYESPDARPPLAVRR